SAEEDPTLYEQELKQKKDDSRVVDDAEHESPVRLFKINVKDKKITRLSNNTDWIQGFTVSPDGKWAAAEHKKSLHYTFDQKVPPVVVLYDLTKGTSKQIQGPGRFVPLRLEFARDNSGVYISIPYSTSPKFHTASITQLYFYDVASEKFTQVNLEWENGIGYEL